MRRGRGPSCAHWPWSRCWSRPALVGARAPMVGCACLVGDQSRASGPHRGRGAVGRPLETGRRQSVGEAEGRWREMRDLKQGGTVFRDWTVWGGRRLCVRVHARVPLSARLLRTCSQHQRGGCCLCCCGPDCLHRRPWCEQRGPCGARSALTQLCWTSFVGGWGRGARQTRHLCS